MNDQTATDIVPPVGTVCGMCGAKYGIDGWHNNGEPAPLLAPPDGGQTTSPDGWHNNGAPPVADK